MRAVAVDLGSADSRWFVDGVPEALFSQGQHFRWAVLDTSSKQTRIELGSQAPPSVHVCTDQAIKPDSG
eukprot:3099821-Amphidinium_carterae.1